MGDHADRMRRKTLRQDQTIDTEAEFYSVIEQILKRTTLSGFQVVGILSHFQARTDLQIIQMQAGEDDRVAEEERRKAEAEAAAKAEADLKARKEYAARHV